MFTLSEMPFALLKDFENVVVYIYDSLRPFNVPCPTIIITSPSRDIWFEFNKLATCKLKWFGVWDHDNELDLLHYHCFSSISVDDMDRKVKLWSGPVPRIVLTSERSRNRSQKRNFKAWYNVVSNAIDS